MAAMKSSITFNFQNYNAAQENNVSKSINGPASLPPTPLLSKKNTFARCTLPSEIVEVADDQAPDHRVPHHISSPGRLYENPSGNQHNLGFTPHLMPNSTGQQTLKTNQQDVSSLNPNMMPMMRPYRPEPMPIRNNHSGLVYSDIHSTGFSNCTMSHTGSPSFTDQGIGSSRSAIGVSNTLLKPHTGPYLRLLQHITNGSNINFSAYSMPLNTRMLEFTYSDLSNFGMLPQSGSHQTRPDLGFHSVTTSSQNNSFQSKGPQYCRTGPQMDFPSTATSQPAGSLHSEHPNGTNGLHIGSSNMVMPNSAHIEHEKSLTTEPVPGTSIPNLVVQPQVNSYKNSAFLTPHNAEPSSTQNIPPQGSELEGRPYKEMVAEEEVATNQVTSENQGIDLKPRRRKYVPKVVIQRKKPHATKKSTPQNASEDRLKRKYVKKKWWPVGNSDLLTQKDANLPSNPIEAPQSSTPKAVNRAAQKKSSVDRPKRKYVRKKGVEPTLVETTVDANEAGRPVGTSNYITHKVTNFPNNPIASSPSTSIDGTDQMLGTSQIAGRNMNTTSLMLGSFTGYPYPMLPHYANNSIVTPVNNCQMGLYKENLASHAKRSDNLILQTSKSPYSNVPSLIPDGRKRDYSALVSSTGLTGQVRAEQSPRIIETSKKIRIWNGNTNGLNITQNYVSVLHNPSSTFPSVRLDGRVRSLADTQRPVELHKRNNTKMLFFRTSEGNLLGCTSNDSLISPRPKGRSRGKKSSLGSANLMVGGPAALDYTIDLLIQKMSGLDINCISETVPGQPCYALVPYQSGVSDGQIVLYDEGIIKKKKRKSRAQVNLDPVTSQVWNLLMGKGMKDGIETVNENDKKKMEAEREVFRGRVGSFIARMHLVQGDRCFSPWKGSVVDSLVGVFLQNVSDHLLSSVFMALAAKYPVKTHLKNSEPRESTLIVSRPSNSNPYARDFVNLTKWHHQREVIIEDFTDIASQGRVCQLCGDNGYADLLIDCSCCHRAARHQYCMDVIPKFGEDIEWSCEDCNLKFLRRSHGMAQEEICTNHKNNRWLRRPLIEFDGWVRKEDGESNVLWDLQWEAIGTAVNTWIKAPDATPNQYEDPIDPFHIAYKNPISLKMPSQTSSSQPKPQPHAQPEPIYFYTQFQEHMQYLVQQMDTLTSGFQQLESKVDTVFQKLGDRIRRLEEYHQAYDARFIEIGRFRDTVKSNWCAQFNNWDNSTENFVKNAYFTDEPGEVGGNANEENDNDGSGGEDMEK